MEAALAAEPLEFVLHVGDIIQIDSEYMYVSAESAGEVTVVRAFGAATTTSVSHDTSSTFYIRYNARLEGADSSTSPWTEVSSNTNCSTIFHKSVNVSRDDQLFQSYGRVASGVDTRILPVRRSPGCLAVLNVQTPYPPPGGVPGVEKR